jgi:SAM-dependent MidA family methyltransferase
VSELRKIIEQEIHDCGPIPFSRYMELCLYHPQLGYYSRNAELFGKGGDFFTSSDVHAVFGRLVARQFDEMWRALGSPSEITIQELGPGRGLFAQDVLDWSAKKFPEFFHTLRYTLIEQSATLRQRMAETLKSHFDSGKVSFGSAHDRAKAPVIVFANEFFDAFPVDVVSSQGSLRIGARDGRFVESWVRTSTEELEFLDRYSVHPGEDERVEVSLAAQKHLSSMCNFDHGFMIVIDYGYTREEQLAGRHRGTVKSIRRHSVSASPYEAPGEQDITADVNFTALRDAAERQGVDVQKLVTQAQFLMGIGEANQFADAFEDSRMPQERAKVALQLKHLVTPAGIGESFRVLIMSKGVEEGKARRLAGLNFGKRLG